MHMHDSNKSPPTSASAGTCHVSHTICWTHSMYQAVFEASPLAYFGKTHRQLLLPEQDVWLRCIQQTVLPVLFPVTAVYLANAPALWNIWNYYLGNTGPSFRSMMHRGMGSLNDCASDAMHPSIGTGVAAAHLELLQILSMHFPVPWWYF